MNIPTFSIGLVIAALAASAGFANSSTSAVQCGVSKSSENGMLALQGTILSPTAMSGEYRFAIQSSSNGGSSNISQGGYFEAAAGAVTPLGKVMVNAGSTYNVVFDVTAGGQKIDCNQDIASLR